MPCLELNAVLLLIRNARRASDSRRVNDVAYLLELIEDKVTDLVTADESVDQGHSSLSYIPEGIQADAHYSGPFRRRTDPPHGHHSSAHCREDAS
jgi:hypothetical protein